MIILVHILMRLFYILSLHFFIVSSIADEPLIGWVEKYYGPVGITASIFSGLLTFIWVNGEGVANIIPADKTANALIVTAWDVYNQSTR